MALTVDYESAVWTLVVAISVLVMTTVGVAFFAIVYASHEVVALAFNSMKRAVELFVIAEFSVLAHGVGCDEVAADVGARRRRVRRVDVRITLEIHVIATRVLVLCSVVVAGRFCLAVESANC